jgi:hypothetical protein
MSHQETRMKNKNVSYYRTDTRQRRKHTLYFGVVALLALSAATAQVLAQGLPGSTGIDASGSTRLEKAACNTGMSQQDYATCMREADSAASEKQKGQLGNGATGTDLRANAAKRCEVLTGEEKIACQARVLGYGSASGSVAGGGVVKQVETVVVPVPGSVTIQPKTSSDIVVIPATK